jgi:hypothetical protein
LGSCQKNTEENSNVEKFDRKTGRFETMDEFSGRVFQLIAKDDYKGISDLMPDLSEYQKLLDNSSLSAEVKEREAKQLEERLKNNIESLKQSYLSFKEQVDRSGIDWTQSTLDFTDFKHTKENNIEKADLTINFKFKGVNYKINITNCYKLKDTWLMGSRISFSSYTNNYYYNY